jgi:hypothetical protein
MVCFKVRIRSQVWVGGFYSDCMNSYRKMSHVLQTLFSPLLAEGPLVSPFLGLQEVNIGELLALPTIYMIITYKQS